ncbi:MAG: zinc-ribbon domain-containing protein [Cystobacterineae bacterium]|nr:zinc-ribbon domain-containing protein [Cystobacterineae bacterium]
MLISCEQCSTTYSLDDYLLVPGGVPVQCTRCGHVFVALPGAEEGEVGSSPLPPPEGIPFYGGEQPSLGSTQLFGAMPTEQQAPSLLSPPSSDEEVFEYGQVREMGLHAQGNEGVAGEVAYFDFGAGYSNEDPLGGQFMRELEKAAAVPEVPPEKTSPPSSASQRAFSSHMSSHMSSSTSLLTEQAQQEEPVTDPGLAGVTDESFAPVQQNFPADLSATVVEEIRRVENEQAAQLQRFHQSADFLEPAKKARRWMFLVVVLLVAILVVFAGAWLVLGHSPVQVWLEIQRLVDLGAKSS